MRSATYYDDVFICYMVLIRRNFVHCVFFVRLHLHLWKEVSYSGEIHYVVSAHNVFLTNKDIYVDMVYLVQWAAFCFPNE